MNYKEMLKKAEKEGSIENLTPDFVLFDKKGQSLIGEFISKNKVQSSKNAGEYTQYLFKTDNGLVKCHLGSATDAELDATMTPGGFYNITYEGKEELGGGKRVNKFKVFCFGHRDEIIEPPFAPGSSRESEGKNGA